MPAWVGQLLFGKYMTSMKAKEFLKLRWSSFRVLVNTRGGREARGRRTGTVFVSYLLETGFRKDGVSY